MASAMKFCYYNQQRRENINNRSSSMINRSMTIERASSIESRLEEFKRRFRRSGSLGLPFFPEEDMRSIQNDLTVTNEQDEEEAEEQNSQLLTIIVKTTRDSESLMKILQTLRGDIKLKHLESRAAQSDNADRIDVLIEMQLINNRHRLSPSDIVARLRSLGLDVDEVGCTLAPNHTSINDVYFYAGATDATSGCQWFPRTINELDICSKKVVMYGSGLDADHPGFKDEQYRKRRMLFAELALNYKQGEPIPRVEYTSDEINTWRTIYRKLRDLHRKHACQIFLDNFELLERHCGYSEFNIPQLDDVNRFLKAKTGFRVRPVAGYLSSRDFLAGLAFRVFNCTQYIRHHELPFYTPEPDCVHELMGHMALFADPDFAQFSQEIGLASLGASEEDLSKLATLYFFTIEFGLCSQKVTTDNASITNSTKSVAKPCYKVYGAGLLSSVGELQHAIESDTAEILRFDPDRVVQQECLITTFQTAYFYTADFEEAQQKLRTFTNNMNRPFIVRYNAYTESVEILNNKRSLMLAVNSLRSDVNLLASALHYIL